MRGSSAIAAGFLGGFLTAATFDGVAQTAPGRHDDLAVCRALVRELRAQREAMEAGAVAILVERDAAQGRADRMLKDRRVLRQRLKDAGQDVGPDSMDPEATP